MTHQIRDIIPFPEEKKSQRYFIATKERASYAGEGLYRGDQMGAGYSYRNSPEPLRNSKPGGKKPTKRFSSLSVIVTRPSRPSPASGDAASRWEGSIAFPAFVASRKSETMAVQATNRMSCMLAKKNLGGKMTAVT